MELKKDSLMYTQPNPALALPSKARQKRNWTPLLIVGGMTGIGFMVTLCFIGFLVVVGLSQDRIANGVAIAGIAIGGETLDDAASLLQQANFNQPITLVDGDRSWQVTLAELGVSVDTPATLKRAFDAAKGTHIEPVYKIDLSQTQTTLIDMSEQINIAAVPGNPPQIGRAIEIPVILDRLRIDASGELGDGLLELNMIVVEPPIIEENNTYTGVTTTHIVQSGQELALIAKEYGVNLDDLIQLNGISNPNIIYVGQELTIPTGGIYQPSAADAPPAPLASGKAIVVSTSAQRIYAYENGQLIHSHLTSTGRAQTPTVLGDYNIYVKHVKTNMSGPDYFLPDVPYTMYFYQGYGIHGTYWHNSFGRPMSHGCVNLPTDEAQWFFDWAEVGTLVRVI